MLVSPNFTIKAQKVKEILAYLSVGKYLMEFKYNKEDVSSIVDPKTGFYSANALTQ